MISSIDDKKNDCNIKEKKCGWVLIQNYQNRILNNYLIFNSDISTFDDAEAFLKAFLIILASFSP